ncbi:hypothetical protein KTQ54_13430 [Komagataeibacter oboediens]|uniref:hypothetical protein n=1 Tax=Komagataeibacter oboediens TaxID=65958 RepID=UPI00200C2673|nr:hypothetical protein [Komagataeibacter oboediens]MBV0889526.1 hypothetical protein [Komagataeibacter oboediens]MCK9821475.1 hypothetical protein [Komagataeibacter oboediens]
MGTSTCAGDDVISTPVTKAIMAIPTLRKTWISPVPGRWAATPRHPAGGRPEDVRAHHPL